MSRILRRSMAGFSFIEAVEVLSFAVSTRGICDRFDFILFRIYIFVLFEPLSNVIAKEIRTSLILKFLYKRVKNNFQFILEYVRVIFGLIIIYEGLVKIQDQKDRIFEGYSCGIYSVLRAGSESSLTFSNSTLSRFSRYLRCFCTDGLSRCQVLYSNFIQAMESRYEYTIA